MQMIFAVKRQANKITEGLRTFQKCLLEKKKRYTIFTSHERSRSHATNTISTWNFLIVESGKTFSSLISWKHGAANGFCGAIHTSYQIRGAEFPFIRGLEKPKLLSTGTSTRHATLKSTLLSQFRYCELCDNDKQSNYSLVNVLFCARALFLHVFKYQTTEERNATIFPSIFRLHAPL